MSGSVCVYMTDWLHTKWGLQKEWESREVVGPSNSTIVMSSCWKWHVVFGGTWTEAKSITAADLLSLLLICHTIFESQDEGATLQQADDDRM